MATRKKSRGRPTAFKASFCEIGHKLAEQGATDREIAEALKIHEATLYRWKHEHPEFREAISLGKDAADDRVEQSMYRRAVGYSFDAVKILQNAGQAVIVPYVEHVPPDVTAGKFWLTNRRGEKWRDRQDVEHSGHISLGEFLEKLP